MQNDTTGARSIYLFTHGFMEFAWNLFRVLHV